MNDIAGNIESLVKTLNISYMEACLKYCEDHGIEIELIGDIVKKNTHLKSQVEIEAQKLNFLKIDDDD